MARCSLVLGLALLLAACDSRTLPQQDAGADGQGRGDRGSQLVDAGKPAGCTTNAQCAANEYCKIEGCAASIGGSCAPQPRGCDTLHAPVCGCDGKSYGNACAAAMAGVNVASKGECGQRCGNLMYLPACPADKVCNLTSCGATEGSCVKKPTPLECAVLSGPVVCGCDGKTYPTDCERLLAGVALAHAGGCTAGGITVVTDKTSYAWGQTVKATLTNGTAASVFLGGCGAYAVEREEGGIWVDKGTTVDCVWEGYAKEVKPGTSYTESVYPSPAATYRIRADYGLGCTAGKPLSSAGCSSFAKAHSAAFVLQPK
jgi:hypothetical protein